MDRPEAVEPMQVGGCGSRRAPQEVQQPPSALRGSSRWHLRGGALLPHATSEPLRGRLHSADGVSPIAACSLEHLVLRLASATNR